MDESRATGETGWVREEGFGWKEGFGLGDCEEDEEWREEGGASSTRRGEARATGRNDHRRTDGAQRARIAGVCVECEAEKNVLEAELMARGTMGMG